MTLAEEIAREHVRWAVWEDRRTLAQVILEVGGALPSLRDVAFEDAVRAVGHAWISLYRDCDEVREAA